MDFGFTEEQEEFRQEVRDFLEEELREGTFTPIPDAWTTEHSPEFTKKVAEKGWIGIDWPKEYGGQGRSLLDHQILDEEMTRYGAPIALHSFADNHHSGTIMILGTEEQKGELLPKIRKGELWLATPATEADGNLNDESIKIRLIEDGDDYIIDGIKEWSTHAHKANYLRVYFLADPEAPKGKRIGHIFVDPSSPGVTITPRTILSGHQPFSRVVFDNVRVPKKNLLRPPGDAGEAGHWVHVWAMVSRVMGSQPLWDAFLQFIKKTKRDGKPLSKDPLVRSKVAQIEIEREVGRLLSYRAAVTFDQGGDVKSAEAPIVKGYGAEFMQRQADTIMEILGLYGQLMPASQLGPILERAASMYFFSKAHTIRAIPAENQWSRIAEQGLGLPSYLNPPHCTI